MFLILSLILLSLNPQAKTIEAMNNKVDDGYNFWLYTPQTVLNSDEGKPLVIFLHGASLCGNDLNRVKRYGTIDALEKGLDLDAYVIAPQNPGGSWKPDKIMNVVNYVKENYNIDSNKVYVLGMSLGGYGSLDLAAAYPNDITAVLSMCGGATQKDLTGLADMPVWIIHGTGDNAVNVSQSDKVVKAIKDAQIDGIDRLHYDRIPGMNHSRPARVFYRKEVYDWLMSHSMADEDWPLHTPPKADDDFFNNAYRDLRSSKK